MNQRSSISNISQGFGVQKLAVKMNPALQHFVKIKSNNLKMLSKNVPHSPKQFGSLFT